MNKKILIISTASLIIAGTGIFGGIKLYQNYQKNNLQAETQVVSNINSYFGDTGVSSSGVVTNDFSQEVYALEEQKIVEVFVEEGQSVQAGDPLISYDITLAKLELEMKELEAATSRDRKSVV